MGISLPLCNHFRQHSPPSLLSVCYYLAGAPLQHAGPEMTVIGLKKYKQTWAFYSYVRMITGAARTFSSSDTEHGDGGHAMRDENRTDSNWENTTTCHDITLHTCTGFNVKCNKQHLKLSLLFFSTFLYLLTVHSSSYSSSYFCSASAACLTTYSTFSHLLSIHFISFFSTLFSHFHPLLSLWNFNRTLSYIWHTFTLVPYLKTVNPL